MKIASGTRVGLCDHVPTQAHPGAPVVPVEGMVLEVTTDTDRVVVLVCPACLVRYTETDDLASVVTRQVVIGKGGWSVYVEMGVPS